MLLLTRGGVGRCVPAVRGWRTGGAHMMISPRRVPAESHAPLAAHLSGRAEPMPSPSSSETAAAASAAMTTSSAALLDAGHPANNVPPSIRAKMGVRLHAQPGHPLGQVKKAIQAYFESGTAGVAVASAATPGGNARFTTFDDLPPIVTTGQNFDDLLTPLGHVSRAPTDTYYVTDEALLRCHMTAHQADLLRAGHSAWLMIGDVYRRDEIDATHYPVFHQVDGVRVWERRELAARLGVGEADAAALTAFVVRDLKAALEGVVAALFGSVPIRWVDAYFPFTEPSLELEVFFEGRWLEVLGCGQVRSLILERCGRGDSVGWAFGMGLERLAMVIFGVPDIRLFWSGDPRFHSQFASGRLTGVKFAPYSKYPACYKDVTFWLPSGGAFHENDFFALVREAAGDLVESVKLLDSFTHPKTGRVSHCYRILYRHMDRNLTNEEVDEVQADVRRRVEGELGGVLR